jgi:hypothetical protein
MAFEFLFLHPYPSHPDKSFRVRPVLQEVRTFRAAVPTGKPCRDNIDPMV